MKPRIFIGSSVEGLGIAYSIQQNLTYDAEVTVWDQGVFELSSTTIESLVKILEDSDFGVFVFSNDDILKIRNKKSETIRDNVLFEFGLFIGKLSRERVYFIIPSDTDLHLPTDLLGITPGKFDSNREDGSMQAATGPVSNQIRQKIKKLGKIKPEDENQSGSKKNSETEMNENLWIDDFIAKEYDNAKLKLETLIKDEPDAQKIIENKIWSLYCDLKNNEQEGIKLIDNFLQDNDEEIIAHRGIARIYLWEDYLDKAIGILNKALDKFNFETSLVLVLSECYIKTDGTDKAIQLLNSRNPFENPTIAIEIVDILMNEKEYKQAKDIIHKVYNKFPNNESIRFRYARVAQELNEHEISIFLLKSLTSDFDKNSTYWGYLSNSAIRLDYYDLALTANRKAEELSKSKEAWIISNIGNIFKNKGFYTESIKYFEKGIELNKNSEYAHDRLASSLKLKEEENKKVQDTIKTGRKLIREYLPE